MHIKIQMMKRILELLLESQLINDGTAFQEKPHIKQSGIPQMESSEARVTTLISEHLDKPFQMSERRKELMLEVIICVVTLSVKLQKHKTAQSITDGDIMRPTVTISNWIWRTAIRHFKASNCKLHHSSQR